MHDLGGKIAVVTGGASGIGLASVERMVAGGAKVICADIDAAAGAAVEARHPGSVKFRRTDVTQESEVVAMLQMAVAEFGGLDILFNNAGGASTAHGLDDITLQEWNRELTLNLTAAMLGIKHAAPLLKERGGGSIISTSSVGGTTPGNGVFAYNVAKAGLIHLTKLCAAELARFRIRVNAIAPGIIITPALGNFFARPHVNGEPDPTLLGIGAKAQGYPKPGLPIDIAQTAAFLASDASEFITGQLLVVDGGLTLGPRHAVDPEAPHPFSELF